MEETGCKPELPDPHCTLLEIPWPLQPLLLLGGHFLHMPRPTGHGCFESPAEPEMGCRRLHLSEFPGCPVLASIGDQQVGNLLRSHLCTHPDPGPPLAFPMMCVSGATPPGGLWARHWGHREKSQGPCVREPPPEGRVGNRKSGRGTSISQGSPRHTPPALLPLPLSWGTHCGNPRTPDVACSFPCHVLQIRGLQRQLEIRAVSPGQPSSQGDTLRFPSLPVP